MVIETEYKRSTKGLVFASKDGSPLFGKLRERIVSQFKEDASRRKIAKNLGLSPSTVHNIVKRFRKSGEISVPEGQGRKPLLNARDHQALFTTLYFNLHFLPNW